MRQLTGMGIALGLLITIDAPVLAKSPGATLKLLDTDNDGSVDLTEAKAAAYGALRQAALRMLSQ